MIGCLRQRTVQHTLTQSALIEFKQVIWGKVEVDKREVTLDDMWSIDLAKMNEFKLVQALSEAAVEWMEDEADVDEEGDPPEGWIDSDDDGELGEEPDSDGEVRGC
jgi:hypothetical protein